MIWKLIVAILLGALSGWIASKIMKSKNGFWMNVLLGIVGGAVGGWLGSLIGIGGGWVMSVILAVAGACLILWVVKAITKK